MDLGQGTRLLLLYALRHGERSDGHRELRASDADHGVPRKRQRTPVFGTSIRILKIFPLIFPSAWEKPLQQTLRASRIKINESPRSCGCLVDAFGRALCAPLSVYFRNAEILTLSYRTTPEAVRRLVPQPLVPTSDWVLVHIYNMNDVDWLGKYGECNVMIGAELPEKSLADSRLFSFSIAMGVSHRGEKSTVNQNVGETRG